MSDDALSQEEVEALMAQMAGGGGAGTETDSSDSGENAPPPQPEPAPAATVSVSRPEPAVRTMEFGPVGGSVAGGSRNSVDLILDVQLQVTVELGRSLMLVRDVLALGPGSVVELDSHAGEPVSVVVNNKVVARGEVVVIDESFGVRITEIVNANERDVRLKAA